MSLIIRTQIVEIKLESAGYSSSSNQTQEVIDDLRRVADELEEWQKKEYRFQSHLFQKPIVFTMSRSSDGSTSAPPFEEVPAIFSEVVAKSVEELEVSVGLYNVLKNANFRTIGEVARCSEQEILDRDMKNFSRKKLNELKEVLGSLGLKLRE